MSLRGSKADVYATYSATMIISDPEKYDLAAKGEFEFVEAAATKSVAGRQYRTSAFRKVLRNIAILAVFTIVQYRVLQWIWLSQADSRVGEDSSLRLSLVNTLLYNFDTESLFLYVQHYENRF